ncbi:MAG TPA: P-loop NTPase fold protein, partial [Candidatus Saccharimonadales bacterium]|nr:P-loop NTPase fold protein [Candidatus Saccharimonadales bacterium]
CEADKLLVVIDNLDRATEENAIRILSTIKSFLEYDKCLYLIPCDEAAMKKHLARVFGESDKGANVKNADEFLRKFFNTHLRIPQFIDADLQDYTEKQLRLTNFHHYARIQDLATVITAAYRENPRQIKQFINIFLSHFLLAQEREREGHLSRGDITNNPEFLAKILVIQQRWPAAYVLIRTGSSLEDAADEADYRNFLEASSLADEPANLKAFLYFKQSKRASDLPPGLADLLETATHDAKFDDVQHFIHQIQDVKDHTMQLNRFFLELLENAAGLGRRQQLVNILNSLAHVWASKTFKLQDNLMRHAARVIKNKLTARDLFAVADDFVTELLAEIGSKSTKDIIADKYMDAIKLLGDVQHGIPKDDVGGVSRCINFIEANAGLYDTPAKRQKLSLSLERSSQFLSLSQINQSKNVIALCDASFILHIINGISLNDMPRRHKSRVTSKYRIKSEIIKFAYTANRERYLTTNDGLLIKDSYLQASAPLIAEVLSKAASPYHWSVLRVFAEVFSEYRGYIRDEETTASLIQQLLKAGHELEEGEHTADILQVLLLLQGHVNQEQNAKIEQFVREFAAKKASNTYLLLSHPSLDSDRMFELIYPALLDTVFKEAAFVSVIWNYGNEAKQLNLIRKLLTEGAGYDGGLRLVEQHLEAGDLPNKAEVSSLLLQGARQEHPKNRGYYYKLLLRLPLPGREQKIEFANQLANLAMHDEREFQVRAHKWIQESGALLSKGLRRTICFKIIGWLEKQGTLNRQYLNAINICLDDLNTLVRSDRQRLYTVIFDQWLVEEEDSQEVRRAATDLRIKTVPLAELKGYLARVEEWSNYYPTASELLFLKKHWEATAKR